MYPFWAPDGGWVGFFARGWLRFVYVDGAPGRQLAEATPEARGATVNAAGVILFAGDRGQSLRRIDFDGGDDVTLARPRVDAGEIAYMWPQFLPDGEHFLFFVASDEADVEGIYVSSLSDPEQRRRLLASSSNGQYASDHLLYLREDTLMARPFDAATRQWSGDERSLQLRVATAFNAQATFSVARNGALAYEPPTTSNLQWFDSTRRVLAPIDEPANRRNPAFSPTSQRVAVESHVGNRSEILVFHADGRRNRVPAPSTFIENPVWHPDGRRLAFVGRLLDHYALYLWNADSTARPVMLFSSTSEKMPGDVTPDGRFLVYDDKSLDGGWDIRALDLDDPAAEPLDVIVTDGLDSNGRVSPSGNLIAYVTDTSGDPHVYVTPFTPGGIDAAGDPDSVHCWISDADGGYDPHWGASDDEIYYLRRDGRLMRVALDDPTRCAPDDVRPQALFASGVDAPGSSRNHYAVDVGGGRFLFATPQAEGSSPRVSTNWLDRLSR